MILTVMLQDQLVLQGEASSSPGSDHVGLIINIWLMIKVSLGLMPLDSAALSFLFFNGLPSWLTGYFSLTLLCDSG